MSDPKQDEFTYTLDVDGTVYGLTDEFRKYVQEAAESAYEPNEYVSTYWTNRNGEPVLIIETCGKRMPFEHIDEVASNPDAVDGDDERLYVLQEHSDNENVEQPERKDDDTTLPENTEEMPENEDVLVVPIPKVAPHNRWEVGEAIVPMEGTYERNLQEMVDVGDMSLDGYNETARYPDGESYDAPIGQSSIEWLLDQFDCPVIEEPEMVDEDDSAEQARKPDGWFDEADEGEKKKQGEVGTRWRL